MCDDQSRDLKRRMAIRHSACVACGAKSVVDLNIARHSAVWCDAIEIAMHSACNAAWDIDVAAADDGWAMALCCSD